MLAILSLCIFLAAFLQYTRARRHAEVLASEYHFLVLSHGYTAMAKQWPSNMPLSRHTPWPLDDSWLGRLSMDRKSLISVYDDWKESIRAAALRDHYHAAAKNPFLLLNEPPVADSLTSLPTTDAELRSWWVNELQDHVIYNGLHGTYQVSMDTDMLARDAIFVNYDYSDGKIDLDWKRIHEIVENQYQPETVAR